MLKYYLYQSQSAISPVDIRDVDILRTALRNNAAVGTTGFLYKSRTHFFQYFEGPPDVADQLLANLLQDDRHFDLQVLSSGTVTTRRFADWSMGYADFRDVDPLTNIEPNESPSVILSKLERKSRAHVVKDPRTVIREGDEISTESPAQASSDVIVPNREYSKADESRN